MKTGLFKKVLAEAVHRITSSSDVEDLAKMMELPIREEKMRFHEKLVKKMRTDKSIQKRIIPPSWA